MYSFHDHGTVSPFHCPDGPLSAMYSQGITDIVSNSVMSKQQPSSSGLCCTLFVHKKRKDFNAAFASLCPCASPPAQAARRSSTSAYSMAAARLARLARFAVEGLSKVDR